MRCEERLKSALWKGFFNRSAYNSLEKKEKWVKLQLSKIQPGSRILDAGAGTGRYRDSCRHLKYVSQDLAEYDGKGDDTGFQSGEWKQLEYDIISDICAIPEPDSSFDAIMCTDVLEHVVNPIKAIEEFSRLLKVEGRLILTVPFCCIAHQSPFFFSSGYSHCFFEEVLAKAGCKISELIFNGNYFSKAQEDLALTYQAARKYASPNFLERCVFLFSSAILIHIFRRWSEKDIASNTTLTQNLQILAIKVVMSS